MSCWRRAAAATVSKSTMPSLASWRARFFVRFIAYLTDELGYRRPSLICLGSIACASALAPAQAICTSGVFCLATREIATFADQFLVKTGANGHRRVIPGGLQCSERCLGIARDNRQRRD